MIHLKRFNITIVAVSIIAIAMMLCIFPFAKQTEKVNELPPLRKVSEYVININTADESELALLRGLGEVTARAIVEYRNESGAFKSISELDNVHGIGDKKLSAWREFITVGD